MYQIPRRPSDAYQFLHPFLPYQLAYAILAVTPSSRPGTRYFVKVLQNTASAEVHPKTEVPGT